MYVCSEESGVGVGNGSGVMWGGRGWVGVGECGWSREWSGWYTEWMRGGVVSVGLGGVVDGV